MAYFEIQAMIRGYHQYKGIWDAKFGEQLECQRETGNPHDIFAVAVLKSGTGVVGHIPKKISSICSLFLRRGGAIHCRVTGAMCYSADLQQGRLEIPCILKFEIDSEKLRCLLDKTKKLVSFALGKGEVQLAHLTQELHHKEDSESNIPEAKKMKLSECKNLTKWQRDIMDG